MLQQHIGVICKSCPISEDPTVKTFSINAIAELLERDRATVVRALRDVPADATEKRQPRWRMAKAVAALERHNHVNDDSVAGTADWAVTAAYEQLDAAIAAMEAGRSLEDRRSMAIQIVKPLLAKTDRMMREAGRVTGQDAELVALRADHLGLVMLRAFERPCEWTFDDVQKAIGI